MGHVDKFEVVLDNDLAVYCEGDRISGHVDIVNSEDIKYKVIFWTKLNLEDKESQKYDVNELKGGDLVKEEYREEVIFLEKDGRFLDKDPVLPPGEHRFPFDCKLPQELPSSFEGQYGRVRYAAQAVIERSGFKSSVTCRRMFTVISGLDLSFLPESSTKIEIYKHKELGLFCTDGSVTIDWVVDRSGFVPGEDVLIRGSVQNDSKQTVSSSTVTLFMVVEYKSKKRWRKECRKIADAEKSATVKDEVTIWNDSLHIPPVPPTGLGRSKLIDINYELEFKVVIEGGYAPIVWKKELYVGTVPASGNEIMTYAAMSNLSCRSSLTPSDMDDSCNDLRSQADMNAVIIMDPSAPTQATLGSVTACYSTPHECIYPSINIVEERPPPFAPGHGDDLLYHMTGLDLPGETPSAPSSITLTRPWPAEETLAFNPSFQSVSVSDQSSSQVMTGMNASNETDCVKNYHPVYVYYPTLGADHGQGDDTGPK